MLVQKEHNVIKFKSEIVLLQNKQSESDNTYRHIGELILDLTTADDIGGNRLLEFFDV